MCPSKERVKLLKHINSSDCKVPIKDKSYSMDDPSTFQECYLTSSRKICLMRYCRVKI